MKTREVYIRLRLAVLVWSLMLYSLSACVHPGTNMAPGSDRSNHGARAAQLRHNAKQSTLDRRAEGLRSTFVTSQARARAAQKPKPCYKSIYTKTVAAVFVCLLIVAAIFGMPFLNQKTGNRKPNIGDGTNNVPRLPTGKNSTYIDQTLTKVESTTRIPSRLTFTDSLEHKIPLWEKNPIMLLDWTHSDGPTEDPHRKNLADASRKLARDFSEGTITALLNLGVNVYALDNNMINLLELAAETGKPETIEFLSKNFKQWKTKGAKGHNNTAIHHLITNIDLDNYEPDKLKKNLRLLVDQAQISPCLKNISGKMASCYPEKYRIDLREIVENIKEIVEKEEEICQIGKNDKCGQNNQRLEKKKKR